MIFRVAGGPGIGFGHLRRSWTLGAELMRIGMQVRFVTATIDGEALLADAGFAVEVEQRPDALDMTFKALHLGPLPRLCVVDDPHMSAHGLAALQWHGPVVCLDDTGERNVPVDLVVNGSAGAEVLVYRGLPETRYLLGPSYILLRPNFVLDPVRPVWGAKVRRVLILTGGGRVDRLLFELTKVVLEVLPRVCVDVVLGPFSIPSALLRSLPDGVSVHQNPKDIRSLMMTADMAVSAGGQTVYELAATATPTLGVRMAFNQALNLQGLARIGCLRDLGSPDDPCFWDGLQVALREFDERPDVRRALGTQGRCAVDGRGTERVAAAVEELVTRRSRPGLPCLN